MKKIFKSRLFIFILGILVCTGITVLADSLTNANDVLYAPNNSAFNVSTVKEALDELYDKADPSKYIYKIDFSNLEYTTEIASGGSYTITDDAINVIAPGGWAATNLYLTNIPFNNYKLIRITYDFTAGYDWGFALRENAQDSGVWLTGSSVYGHGNVGRKTEVFIIPDDKEYTMMNICSSSLSAVLNVYEITLINLEA